jgi:hypothetical protein
VTPPRLRHTDRADYQRDLVVSRFKVGTTEKQANEPRLQRALSILETLKSSGRLAPVNEPMFSHLRKVLGEGGVTSQ